MMDITSWLFYIASAISQASIFAIIVLIVPFLLSLLHRNKIASIVLYALFTLFAQVVLILDIFIFDIYKFHINGFILEMVFGDSASDIFVIDTSVYLWMFCILIVFALIPIAIIIILSFKKASTYKNKRLKIFITIFALSTVTCNLMYIFGYAFNSLGIQKSATVLPYYYPLRANSLLLKLGIISEDNDLPSLDAKNNFIEYPKSPIESTESQNMNIVLILIDSWNPRTFTPEIMPSLYEFSKRQIYFPNIRVRVMVHKGLCLAYSLVYLTLMVTISKWQE